ncbi:hypothetical protein HY604_00090 [Candidatus Peregrinibacteria bacterium]|nr:hypothetical protein [Candidatus Peregrinibacteria bacterium]
MKKTSLLHTNRFLFQEIQDKKGPESIDEKLLSGGNEVEKMAAKLDSGDDKYEKQLAADDQNIEANENKGGIKFIERAFQELGYGTACPANESDSILDSGTVFMHNNRNGFRLRYDNGGGDIALKTGTKANDEPWQMFKDTTELYNHLKTLYSAGKI